MKVRVSDLTSAEVGRVVELAETEDDYRTIGILQAIVYRTDTVMLYVGGIDGTYPNDAEIEVIDVLRAKPRELKQGDVRIGDRVRIAMEDGSAVEGAVSEMAGDGGVVSVDVMEVPFSGGLRSVTLLEKAER